MDSALVFRTRWNQSTRRHVCEWETASRCGEAEDCRPCTPRGAALWHLTPAQGQSRVCQQNPWQVGDKTLAFGEMANSQTNVDAGNLKWQQAMLGILSRSGSSGRESKRLNVPSRSIWWNINWFSISWCCLTCWTAFPGTAVSECKHSRVASSWDSQH